MKGYIMNSLEKYENITTVLPKLQPVLLDAIQSDFLEIQAINRDCEKFIQSSHEIPALKEARFVVYSKYIRKSEHKYEKFIFLDKEGHEVCHVDGEEMELYGLFDRCIALEMSKDYKQQEFYTNRSRV